MKALSNFITVALLLGICGVCEAQQSTTDQSSIPSPTPYSIVANDANSRIWERTVYEQGPDGQVVATTHSYTELATGLNHLVNGQWVPSKEEIDILPDGTAAATNGQHQVYFPSDIYNGEIKMVTLT
jgi:archaellum component FlaF (FlaF/FlaG flagellin family)